MGLGKLWNLGQWIERGLRCFCGQSGLNALRWNWNNGSQTEHLHVNLACLSLSEWGFVVEWDWTLSWCVFHGLMFGPLGLHGLGVWGTSYRATYTMFQACGGYRVLRCRLDSWLLPRAASTSSFAPGNLLRMLAFLCESSLSRGQHVEAWLQRRVSTSQTSQTKITTIFTICSQ